VFGLSGSGNESEMNEVARSIPHLNEEFGRLRRLLATTKLKSEDYEPSLAPLAGMLTVSAAFTTTWQGYSQMLSTSPALGMLRICSSFLPGDEVAVTDEQFAELQTAIGLLEESISQLWPGDFLYGFLTEQVADMRRAIRDYRIVGVHALRKATYRYAGAIHSQFGSAKANEPEPVSRARKVYRVIRGIVVAVDLAAKALAGGEKLTHAGIEVAKHYLHAGEQSVEHTELPPSSDGSDFSVDEL